MPLNKVDYCASMRFGRGNLSMECMTAEATGHFTPFEFKSPLDHPEVQFIRDDASSVERVFRKSKNNVLNNAVYESDDDDAHTSDENTDIEFDRV
ncbi:hypothetical protein Y032_0044g1022 [Ancylostoma ceylanicum]|uniref:Uncharacterized protein n=1 Tax=Ancylostoma ceylanicum TaxID=53326 RepID=A0A016UE39_9BILA|nr:hypothetical protein Y032_0044g1022 [Ancylostoma ceylanicum]